MGAFSLWHGLILLILLAIPAAVIAAIVFFVNRSGRKGKGG